MQCLAKTKIEPMGSPSPVCWQLAGLSEITKERLHLSCRCECDQELARLFADLRPNMWNSSTHEDRIARFQRCLLLSNLHAEFSFHCVQPLVLLGMYVTIFSLLFEPCRIRTSSASRTSARRTVSSSIGLTIHCAG